jgi:hypothetical protein
MLERRTNMDLDSDLKRLNNRVAALEAAAIAPAAELPMVPKTGVAATSPFDDRLMQLEGMVEMLATHVQSLQAERSGVDALADRVTALEEARNAVAADDDDTGEDPLGLEAGPEGEGEPHEREHLKKSKTKKHGK